MIADEYTKSFDDGYHFGCWQDFGDPAFIESLVTGLARRLAKLFDGALRRVCALDYRWFEVWGDDIKLRTDARASPMGLMRREATAKSQKYCRHRQRGTPHRSDPNHSAAGGTPRRLVPFLHELVSVSRWTRELMLRQLPTGLIN